MKINICHNAIVASIISIVSRFTIYVKIFTSPLDRSLACDDKRTLLVSMVLMEGGIIKPLLAT
jgi:hypothetical protein